MYKIDGYRFNNMVEYANYLEDKKLAGRTNIINPKNYGAIPISEEEFEKTMANMYIKEIDLEIFKG